MDECPWVLMGAGDHDATLFPDGRIDRVFTNNDVDNFRLSHSSINNNFFLERWRIYAPRRPTTINFPVLTHPNKFIGRNLILSTLLKHINVEQKRLVSITSSTRGGIGKSELIGKLGEFEGSRRGGRWSAIVYVDCGEVYGIVRKMRLGEIKVSGVKSTTQFSTQFSTQLTKSIKDWEPLRRYNSTLRRRR